MFRLIIYFGLRWGYDNLLSSAVKSSGNREASDIIGDTRFDWVSVFFLFVFCISGVLV